VNNGIANYGIFSLAVDPSNPQTLYAATEGGLCKSINGAESWELLPETATKKLRITGEKFKSIHAIAVSPRDSATLLAASPGGKIFRSTDGGQTWKAVFEKDAVAGDPESLTVRFGEPFGGIFFPFSLPSEAVGKNLSGIGLTLQGAATNAPKDAYVSITAGGGSYRSPNLATNLADSKWQDIILAAKDFTVDPWWASQHKDKAAELPATPNLSSVNRMDFTVVGGTTTAIKLRRIFFALESGGQGAPTAAPSLVSIKALTPQASVLNYGNVKSGVPDPAPIYSVAFSSKNPLLAVGATGDSGLVLSQDGGRQWKQLPNQPGSRRMFYGLMVDPTNPKRLFWGACGNGGGVYRSEDGGESWTKVFSEQQWVFNLLVTGDGTVYCGANSLWQSTDHGTTWKKLGELQPGGTVCGIEADPRDPKTLWASLVTWDLSSRGGVYKTTDGGETWTNITGDLPYVKPLILRFNPATNELWAGGVTLHKLKQ
jgi:photosystem II stability/assembly factor-like uncharacterized protein